jgi:hypothetical protein
VLPPTLPKPTSNGACDKTLGRARWHDLPGSLGGIAGMVVQGCRGTATISSREGSLRRSDKLALEDHDIIVCECLDEEPVFAVRQPEGD